MWLFGKRSSLGEIKRLRVDPGDTIVLKCDDALDPPEAAQIKEQAEAALPGVRCMVLSGGLELPVVLHHAVKLDQRVIAEGAVRFAARRASLGGGA